METADAKKPTKFFGLSKNVISMGAVSFLNDLSSDMIFPFIPIFLTSVLGANASFVGLVEGVADSAASVFKMVSGRLSDKWKIHKPLVLFGYSLSAVSKPILAFAFSPWQVLVVRFFDRTGKGTREAPRDALISLSSERKSFGRAFGFHKTADTLGAAFGPLLGFIILPAVGGNLRTLFLLSFVASFFAVLILRIFVKEVRGDKISKEESAPLKFDLKKMGPSFTIFLACATLFTLGRASEAFMFLKAKEVGVALSFLPLIYFVYNIIFAAFSAPAGILSDKIGHRNTFMLGMLVFSATYFLFAKAGSAAAVWILFAVFGFYSALTEGVGRAIVAGLVPEESRATAYGIYSAFTGIALLPASLIFGLLWDKFGSSVSFYYGAALGLVSLLIFLFLRLKYRTKTPLQ